MDLVANRFPLGLLPFPVGQGDNLCSNPNDIHIGNALAQLELSDLIQIFERQILD